MGMNSLARLVIPSSALLLAIGHTYVMYLQSWCYLLSSVILGLPTALVSPMLTVHEWIGQGLVCHCQLFILGQVNPNLKLLFCTNKSSSWTSNQSNTHLQIKIIQLELLELVCLPINSTSSWLWPLIYLDSLFSKSTHSIDSQLDVINYGERCELGELNFGLKQYLFSLPPYPRVNIMPYFSMSEAFTHLHHLSSILPPSSSLYYNSNITPVRP